MSLRRKCPHALSMMLHMYAQSGFHKNERRPLCQLRSRRLFSENLLQAQTANILFDCSPECVPVDASGKFFAYFQFRWRTRF